MIELSGTLESTGINRSGATDAPVTELNYNSMGANGSTNATTDYIGQGGLNTFPSPRTPLVDAVNTSNDTTTMEVSSSGTLEDGGLNG